MTYRSYKIIDHLFVKGFDVKTITLINVKSTDTISYIKKNINYKRLSKMER